MILHVPGVTFSKWPVLFLYQCTECAAIFEPQLEDDEGNPVDDFTIVPPTPPSEWDEGQPEMMTVTCPDCGATLSYVRPENGRIASAYTTDQEEPKPIF